MPTRPADITAATVRAPYDQPEIRQAEELPEDATVIYQREDIEIRSSFGLVHKRLRTQYAGPTGRSVPRKISSILTFNGGLGFVFDEKTPAAASSTLLDRQIDTLLQKLAAEKPKTPKRIACVYVSGSLPMLTGRKLGGEALFGKSEVSEVDVATFVIGGLPTETVETLQFWARLTDQEVERLVIPRRTLRHRREKDQALSKEESDRAARIARIVSHAEQVFEDPGKADRWLRRELKSLNGQQPLIMAETEAGARIVEELLEKIAWGAAA